MLCIAAMKTFPRTSGSVAIEKWPSCDPMSKYCASDEENIYINIIINDINMSIKQFTEVPSVKHKHVMEPNDPWLSMTLKGCRFHIARKVICPDVLPSTRTVDAPLTAKHVILTEIKDNLRTI